MQKAAHAYMQTQVTTTNQAEVLIMLYDGAISFLNQAKERIEAKDFAAKGNLISKALDILNELDSSLAPEKGGDLATSLHNLYFYCSSRLLMANLKMSTAIIDEVLICLTGLRSAYAEIMTLPEAQAAAAQAAASLGHKGAPVRNAAGANANAPQPVAPPSRGAKGLSMYAQKSGQTFAPAAGTTPAEQEAPSTAAPAAAVPQRQTSDVAKGLPAEPASPQTPSPSQEVQPGAVGFAKRMAASSLYGKFAAG